MCWLIAVAISTVVVAEISFTQSSNLLQSVQSSIW
uniref:Bm13225 n=1 Tax=Brugia malayi TaxID=6279 RepID=A0A1I9G680_BRUMA|nr:Bm13225 [Brugia malayi]